MWVVSEHNKIFDVVLISPYVQLICVFLSLSQHKVVTVPGDHHVHLNKPEAVATFVSDFLRTKVAPASAIQHKL